MLAIATPSYTTSTLMARTVKLPFNGFKISIFAGTLSSSCVKSLARMAPTCSCKWTFCTISLSCNPGSDVCSGTPRTASSYAGCDTSYSTACSAVGRPERKRESTRCTAGRLLGCASSSPSYRSSTRPRVSTTGVTLRTRAIRRPNLSLISSVSFPIGRSSNVEGFDRDTCSTSVRGSGDASDALGPASTRLVGGSSTPKRVTRQSRPSPPRKETDFRRGTAGMTSGKKPGITAIAMSTSAIRSTITSERRMIEEPSLLHGHGVPTNVHFSGASRRSVPRISASIRPPWPSETPSACSRATVRETASRETSSPYSSAASAPKTRAAYAPPSIALRLTDASPLTPLRGSRILSMNGCNDTVSSGTGAISSCTSTDAANAVPCGSVKMIESMRSFSFCASTVAAARANRNVETMPSTSTQQHAHTCPTRKRRILAGIQLSAKQCFSSTSTFVVSMPRDAYIWASFRPQLNLQRQPERSSWVEHQRSLAGKTPIKRRSLCVWWDVWLK
mmetsp:Transcript_17951/g.38819  ORF Transcript_17951/g.38819 Transcript_17951/m.38819 type:complete len:505 (-) Transcript_17951:389-1903(-)